MTVTLGRAWLLMAVGADRQHGGNDGYDDQPDAHYSWDSTVANDTAIAVGDRIVLWDKRAAIGASVIERIDTGVAEKILYRCPACGKAGIKARKFVSPRFNCYKCGAQFDEPKTSMITVTTYRSKHDAGWIDLERSLDGATLRALCYSPKSQLSLRPLRWPEFLDAAKAAGFTSMPSIARRESAVIGGGHDVRTVRVRKGQAAFRDRLLARQGPICAVTGPAPAAVLEAGHLYSYASVGEHHDHGGLLLRRDIHRLFDRGDLAIHPKNLIVDIAAGLMGYSTYSALHGRSLAVPVSSRQVTWLARHWEAHR